MKATDYLRSGANILVPVADPRYLRSGATILVPVADPRKRNPRMAAMREELERLEADQRGASGQPAARQPAVFPAVPVPTGMPYLVPVAGVLKSNPGTASLRENLDRIAATLRDGSTQPTARQSANRPSTGSAPKFPAPVVDVLRRRAR